jgi:sugar lactone lactonase YvrE
MVDQNVPMSVGELKNGKLTAYPDAVLNKVDWSLPQDTYVCVQSVVVDAQNRFWALDPAAPLMKQAVPGGPKLMCFDLANNALTRTFPVPSNAAFPTTYLNDVRFELKHGHEGMAFITDSSADGPNGIIVVELDSGKSWRRLSDHPSTKAEPNFIATFEGQPLMIRDPGKPAKPLAIGTDGIAISADGKTLYYSPLSGHHLYSVSVDALADPDVTDASVAATVKDLGDRGYASDGLETDADNNLYLTDYEHNAIHRRTPSGVDTVLVSGPQLVWPDSMAIGMDGYLYFTCSQVGRQPRFHDGVDQRKPPYGVYRVKIGEHPSGLE